MSKFGVANVEIQFTSLARSIDAVPPTRRSADHSDSVITFRSLSTSTRDEDDTVVCDMRQIMGRAS